MSESCEPASFEDGDIAFRFKLPKVDLALRSVRVIDGVPELLFDARRKVPTIQEEDVATAFRLAQEDTRPAFFYTNFPPTHPLFESRVFMRYSPAWLRWTGVGELLAESDWSMKCLHVGARSDEDKMSFKSWSHTSNLDGLATCLDFPQDQATGPVIMSCEYAKIKVGDNEIQFSEEPKMKIQDYDSSLYSKYITEHYPSIAYDDEPKFLKMQELIKLIIAAEWLFKEKGFRMNQDWIAKHTSKPTDRRCHELDGPEKPPRDMIPVQDTYVRPTSDVMVKTREAEMYKKLTTEGKVKRRYGYCDFGGAEMVMFEEDGTKCPPIRCLKVFREDYSIIGDKSIKEGKGWMYLPMPEPAKHLTEIRDYFLGLLHGNDCSKITDLIPASVDSTIDHDFIDDNIMELKFTKSFQPNPPLTLPPMKKVTILKATLDNYSKLFSSEEVVPDIPSMCKADTPDVKSWGELFTELTVPRPRVWLFPFTGIGKATVAGGVTTRNFEVVSEPINSNVCTKNVAVSAETQWVDDYKYGKKGNSLVVRSKRHLTPVSLNLVKDSDYDKISKEFSGSWKTGHPPEINRLFRITNTNLESKWESYNRSRGNQEPEWYFHGTSLRCNITTTQRVCEIADCGICGISSYGPDSQCIGNNSGLRFGEGFYLAPNSSKSTNYAKESKHGYRALLLCQILPGKMHSLKTSGSQDSIPPGCDSVYVQGGTQYNEYPEIVIKKAQAVMPRYIIVY